jgi:hypothetical protein
LTLRQVEPAAILVAVVLAACDFLYGVNRRAALARLPQVDCVRETLETTPGIDQVDYGAGVGSRPITWTGLQAADQVHTFLFRGDGVQGAVQFVVGYDGDVEFSDTLLELNRKPPQELIDGTRPVMRNLEARLEQRCAVEGLVREVHETCWGVACPEP